MTIKDPAPPMLEEVASPCVGVCTIDPATELCSGCLRTMPEITAWMNYSPEQKKQVLAWVEQRYERSN